MRRALVTTRRACHPVAAVAASGEVVAEPLSSRDEAVGSQLARPPSRQSPASTPRVKVKPLRGHCAVATRTWTRSDTAYVGSYGGRAGGMVGQDEPVGRDVDGNRVLSDVPRQRPSRAERPQITASQAMHGNHAQSDHDSRVPCGHGHDPLTVKPMPSLGTALWLAGGLSLAVVLGLATIAFTPRHIIGTVLRLAIAIPLAPLLGFLTLYATPKHNVPCFDQNALEKHFFGPSSSFGHIDTDGSTPELCHSPPFTSYAASAAVTLLILALGYLWIRRSSPTPSDQPA